LRAGLGGLCSTVLPQPRQSRLDTGNPLKHAVGAHVLFRGRAPSWLDHMGGCYGSAGHMTTVSRRERSLLATSPLRTLGASGAEEKNCRRDRSGRGRMALDLT